METPVWNHTHDKEGHGGLEDRVPAVPPLTVKLQMIASSAGQRHNSQDKDVINSMWPVSDALNIQVCEIQSKSSSDNIPGEDRELPVPTTALHNNDEIMSNIQQQPMGNTAVPINSRHADERKPATVGDEHLHVKTSSDNTASSQLAVDHTNNADEVDVSSTTEQQPIAADNTVKSLTPMDENSTQSKVDPDVDQIQKEGSVVQYNGAIMPKSDISLVKDTKAINLWKRRQIRASVRSQGYTPSPSEPANQITNQKIKLFLQILCNVFGPDFVGKMCNVLVMINSDFFKNQREFMKGNKIFCPSQQFSKYRAKSDGEVTISEIPTESTKESQQQPVAFQTVAAKPLLHPDRKAIELVSKKGTADEKQLQPKTSVATGFEYGSHLNKCLNDSLAAAIVTDIKTKVDKQTDEQGHTTQMQLSDEVVANVCELHETFSDDTTTYLDSFDEQYSLDSMMVIASVKPVKMDTKTMDDDYFMESKLEIFRNEPLDCVTGLIGR